MYSTDSPSETSQKASPQPQLKVHEWLAVAAIAGFLITLTLLVAVKGHDHLLIPDKDEAKLHYLKAQTVEMHIEGAVAKPGSYRVKTGTSIKDVVAMAEPLPNADLRKIRPKSLARNGQNYVVQARPSITIFVSGAVEVQGPHTIPKGTRLFELAQHVALKPFANLEKMKQKRYLKDNEKINVPEIE